MVGSSRLAHSFQGQWGFTVMGASGSNRAPRWGCPARQGPGSFCLEPRALSSGPRKCFDAPGAPCLLRPHGWT